MITSPFVLKLNERNLCTWYILPLVGLNPAHFLEANFIDSFLVKGKMQIAVQVADPNLCTSVMYSHYYDYLTDIGDDETYMVFTVDESWKEDYNNFLQGKYSKFSDAAKRYIRQISGLAYEVPGDDGFKHTSSILLALDQHETLRAAWAEELGIHKEGLPEELLSVPGESCFIEL